MKKEKSKSVNLIKIFALVVAVCLFAISAMVVYVDPFFHYHEPIEGFPYIVDNQLSQNPGMARHMTYDSCIIGSSMTVNFHTDDFKELMEKAKARLGKNENTKA